MPETDPNGISHITETDARGPFSSLMRIITNPLSNVVNRIDAAIAEIRASIAHLIVLYPWTTLAPASGWSANSGGGAPQVARVGPIVFYRGGLFGGAANTTATTLPAWAAPSRTSSVQFRTAADGVGILRLFTGGAMQPSAAIHAENMSIWRVE